MNHAFRVGVSSDLAVTLVFNTLQKTRGLYGSTQIAMISSHV
jgi:hypothetical protein